MVSGGDSGANDDTVFVKEMGIGHEDFFRILPRALGTNDYEVSGTDIVMRDGDKRFEISLGPEKVRTLALMKLQVTMVTLRLANYSEAERVAVLARFDLYFRRGGG